MKFSNASPVRLLAQLLLIAACAMQTASAMQEAEQAISPAEVLLFQTNHLQNIHAAVTLTYSFKKISNLEPGFEDEVQIDVSQPDAEQARQVALHFLSGSRKFDLPEIGSPQGNPALLGFLERDILEMKRLTGGSTAYFRKRIRLALAGSAQLRPVSFSYNGQTVQGQEVKAEPYMDDPMRERFEQFANKSYVFIVSDKVPGGLYQIKTSSSGLAKNATSTDPSVMEETLTLVRETVLQRPGGSDSRLEMNAGTNANAGFESVVKPGI